MDTRDKVRGLLIDVEPKSAVVLELLGTVRLGHAVRQVVGTHDVLGLGDEALHDAIAENADLQGKVASLARRERRHGEEACVVVVVRGHRKRHVDLDRLDELDDAVNLAAQDARGERLSVGCVVRGNGLATSSPDGRSTTDGGEDAAVLATARQRVERSVGVSHEVEVARRVGDSEAEAVLEVADHVVHGVESETSWLGDLGGDECACKLDVGTGTIAGVVGDAEPVEEHARLVEVEQLGGVVVEDDLLHVHIDVGRVLERDDVLGIELFECGSEVGLERDGDAGVSALDVNASVHGSVEDLDAAIECVEELLDKVVPLLLRGDEGNDAAVIDVDEHDEHAVSGDLVEEAVVCMRASEMELVDDHLHEEEVKAHARLLCTVEALDGNQPLSGWILQRVELGNLASVYTRTQIELGPHECVIDVVGKLV
mmetsp:Transcript_21841/g.56191  ORF Transcript_21841/g.56191 Transcript_21841/m.56191 type:complete len:428 (+) Transcript_21841:2170-3453(+)